MIQAQREEKLLLLHHIQRGAVAVSTVMRFAGSVERHRHFLPGVNADSGNKYSRPAGLLSNATVQSRNSNHIKGV
jgi:hypothetical protein